MLKSLVETWEVNNVVPALFSPLGYLGNMLPFSSIREICELNDIILPWMKQLRLKVHPEANSDKLLSKDKLQYIFGTY